LCFFLAACSAFTPQPPPTPAGDVTFTITADGQTQTHATPPGLTLREALVRLNVTLGELDRVTPPLYTIVGDGLAVTITRVTETFEIEQVVAPYTTEIVKSDFVPEGERQLLQVGQNGLEEITYRITFEDGVQVSRSVVKRTMLQAPAPEKILVGSQASFTLVPLTGTLVYLNGGNAWLMRQNSGQRQLVTTSSDLDGVIFELSPDGRWLLYSRAVTNSATLFNTLWAAPLTNALTTPAPLSLPVSNVRYAEWHPAQTTTPTIAYSTYLKISRTPGWQANNDLWLVGWGPDPKTKKTIFITDTVQEISSGGPYGWWGTGYAFSPDGARIAYARTDSIGVIDLATRTTSELTRFTAYNTHADWAWFPQVRWTADGAAIYAVTHGEPFGFESPEDSTVFNLSALLTSSGQRFDLVPRAGMFANPAPSPASPLTGAPPPRIAFFQAVEPDNSPFSRYRLMVMDRDGSNVRALFPPPDQPGLSEKETQAAWSPDALRLAMIYNGNLWLVDPDTGAAQPLTGDGQSVRVMWGK
jgi:hypothetical protein